MKSVYFWIFGVVFLLSIFVFVPRVFAVSSYVSNDSVILPREQVVSGDYFAAGSTVLVDGTVDGDAYVAGGNVVVNGIVHGDVLAAGGNVSVHGKVDGNVRAAGGQLLISGDVAKNVTVAGGSVFLQQPAKIAGSLVATGGNVSLLTPIGKDVTLAGGQVTVDSRIGGDVMGGIGQLTLSPQASIGGDLTYWSETRGAIAQGASVSGQTVFHKTNWQAQKEWQQQIAPWKIFAGLGVVWVVMSFVSAFVLGLLLISFFPVSMNHVVSTVRRRPWASLGYGAVAVVVVPMVILLLLITGIGVPLAFLFGCVFLVALCLSEVLIAFVIGKIVLPQRQVLALLVGLIVYSVISVIPVIGWIWGMIGVFMGVGAMVLVERKLYDTLREKKLL